MNFSFAFIVNALKLVALTHDMNPCLQETINQYMHSNLRSMNFRSAQTRFSSLKVVVNEFHCISIRLVLAFHKLSASFITCGCSFCQLKLLFCSWERRWARMLEAWTNLSSSFARKRSGRFRKQKWHHRRTNETN